MGFYIGRKTSIVSNQMAECSRLQGDKLKFRMLPFKVSANFLTNEINKLKVEA